ncbi:hypothetical protein B4099_2892 [Heyndrickxia coagulans]|uniref:Uncharacterized protein n=1 Tax=Heyndrickxia coagulans TaxID=1398 RepID=A0A150K109_HEYCO|nr:hypothetical protein B4099_2892 [Heyndrickxia coagulans]
MDKDVSKGPGSFKKPVSSKKTPSGFPRMVFFIVPYSPRPHEGPCR